MKKLTERMLWASCVFGGGDGLLYGCRLNDPTRDSIFLSLDGVGEANPIKARRSKERVAKLRVLT